MIIEKIDKDFFELFDKFSKQDIEEGVFYTLLKNDLRIYLTHYTELYDADDWDNDEAVVAVFKNNFGILNYGGALQSVLGEIKKILP